ncbi:uncharacterized protein K452DRAFT_285855 [Aplosporella prunicola CBS 121167]|uniref:Exoribonuclease phosphorolytic domain-containing protein n=1 Tax=Aplosporella prunicola CBS 121167 TaxID=1176127 RepID=A0A6A6BII4_9PEZI|nr:uncharacterized protein K452DRAFT_285855 [Aplosporella prunicola CBS 121167]KAF2143816.1 hypothetical protein K452DRAFT_285855 [Aplosporella prunicola CBS 121167]
MNDRRRTNAPSGGTSAPVFAPALPNYSGPRPQRPVRSRAPNELRKIFLQTGMTPSASGSAYLELPPPANSPTSLAFRAAGLKLSCTVHGPHPLPRSAPFTPYLHLSASLKFAPFAAHARRGYVRDAAERDLGQHLEAALRGIVLGERWPKSGVDVVVTVLEAEEDAWLGSAVEASTGAARAQGQGWAAMNVLAACVTAASAAMADAGIDCVDLAAGGMAALVHDDNNNNGVLVLDPSPAEHRALRAACAVAYLPGRDEITELWLKGDAGEHGDALVEKAVEAAVGAQAVLAEAVREAAARKFPAEAAAGGKVGGAGAADVEMVAA